MQRIGKWILWSSLATITLYRLFSGLQTEQIQQWDEGTNILVIQETTIRESFPILFLSDEPFFEKPPLWYYLQLGLFSRGLNSIFYMRVTSALCGLGIIVLSMLLAKKWWGTIAAYGTWFVLLTTNHLFTTNPEHIFSTHTFRSADVDSLHILLFLLSFACGLYMKRSYLFTCFAGIFAGLSVLTKSPLGLLPLLVLTIVFLIQSQHTMLKIGLAWFCFIGITLPWYLFMYSMFGLQFLDSNMIYHIQLRTIIALEGHYNPWWYYGYLLSNPKIFFVSWLFPLLFFWTLYKRNITTDTLLFACYILCVLFFIIPTIMQTRLAWYILPFYPFAALIVGKALQDIYNTVTKV